jgi:DNA transformation protein and related proteins
MPTPRPTTPADEFAAFCCELLAAAGAMRAKRMFGGHGVYADGLMIGLVAEEVLYLKMDAETRPQFEAAGCQPFTYDPGNGHKPMQMSYWTVPSEAMESPATMTPWARLALGAALRNQTAKNAKAEQAAAKRAAKKLARPKPAAKRPR